MLPNCPVACNDCDIGCADLNEHCPAWKKSGECEGNKVWGILDQDLCTWNSWKIRGTIHKLCLH